MLSSTHATAMPQGMLPGGSFCHSESDAIPLVAFGPINDEDHILVLGGQGPEIMIALLRAGAANVIHLRSCERPEADSASLVIVPLVPSLDWLATALPSIRRALTVQGRVALFAGTHPQTAIQIRRMLRLHGLSAIRAQTTSDGQVVCAERPLRQFAGRNT